MGGDFCEQKELSITNTSRNNKKNLTFRKHPPLSDLRVKPNLNKLMKLNKLFLKSIVLIKH